MLWPDRAWPQPIGGPGYLPWRPMAAAWPNPCGGSQGSFVPDKRIDLVLANGGLLLVSVTLTGTSASTICGHQATRA